jgi:uncharacterized protein YoxC
MSSDNIQRKMDFIVEQQAKFTVDIELLQEAQKQQSANLDRLTIDVQALTSDVQALTYNVQGMASDVQVVVSNVQVVVSNVQGMTIDVQTLGKIIQDGFNETRESVNNLIIANEVTRELAGEVARLAVKTSQRVTLLEEKQ